MPRVPQDALTDSHIRALSPGTRPVDVRDGGRGLILTVLPSGRKQFSLRYCFRGKHRRMVLGDFPALTLSRARQDAQDVRSEIRKGHDPAAERRAAKARRDDTVGALAEDYLTRHARKFKRTAAADERMLDVEVLPTWKDRSVSELTRRDVRDLLDRIVDRGSPVMANRVLALARKMLNFGVDHDWLEANPAARVKKPAREVSRERVLTDDELRRLWRVLSRFPTTVERAAPGRKRSRGSSDDPLCPISAPLAALVKVRLLTAQRGGEVARMRWVDLDLRARVWTISGSDTKNGEPHRVPLAREVVTIINAQRNNRSDKSEKLNGDECKAFVFVGFGASVLDRAKKAPAALSRALGFEFRGHDLRRTAATRMAAAGVPRDHIAQVLNHVDGGARATRVYDRHTYDPQKRAALETWCRSLQLVVRSRQGRRSASGPQSASESPLGRSFQAARRPKRSDVPERRVNVGGGGGSRIVESLSQLIDEAAVVVITGDSTRVAGHSSSPRPST